LLDVYKASGAPAAFAVHDYAVEEGCQVSRNIKGCMGDVLQQSQSVFEASLARTTLADIVATIQRGQ
jgi:DNA-binding IscR family transcriptional regulator